MTDEEMNQVEDSAGGFDEAFAHADEKGGGYYLPPEGSYEGAIPFKKEVGAGRWVQSDAKNGRVRFALLVTSDSEKGKWVWADLDVRHPRDTKGITAGAAKTRVRMMAQAINAFASSMDEAQSMEISFKDKGNWTTTQFTELADDVLKASCATVSFTVKHRSNPDGTPTLITKGKNKGEQRYNVYVNGATK